MAIYYNYYAYGYGYGYDYIATMTTTEIMDDSWAFRVEQHCARCNSHQRTYHFYHYVMKQFYMYVE